MSTLNEKVKEILASKEISPSHFADEIGVQRSSISHILSGRNKPSFDIIQKIIRRYPDLGTEWFLEDTSNKLDSRQNQRSEDSVETQMQKKTVSKPKATSLAAAAQSSNISANKEIEKILIFYKDKTFSEYIPS